MTPVKAVIFDMDGTVLDTLFDLTDSVNHALTAYGFPTRSSDEIRSFLGNGAKMLIHLSVPEGTPSNIEDAVLSHHIDYYALHCNEKTRVYDGIVALLDELRAKGIKTAVVSNKSDIHVKELVQDYFDGLFDVAIGVNDRLPRKPAPDMPLAVMEHLGVDSAETIYVGDSEVDVLTAANAGLQMIAVTWGFRDLQTLTAAGATVFADNAERLSGLIFGNLDNPKTIG